MDSVIINGGRPLTGQIKISGAKNASLPIMTAALLTKEPIRLSNVPRLSDITTMQELLVNHGAEVVYATPEGLHLTIQAKEITNFTAPYDIVRKMRASLWVLGPLLARFGQAEVSLPGGCAIGTRQVDLHIAALEAMGAKIAVVDGYIQATVKGRLKGCEFSFYRVTVGATISAVLAAVLADGTTKLSNCAREPEVVDLCRCLVKMGAEITGIGSEELIIQGKSSLNGCDYRIVPDRIEAGTYMIAAAMTKGDVQICGVDHHLVENLITKLQQSGIEITPSQDSIRVRHVGPIVPVDISTGPYPEFATDLQAQFMSLMTIANGTCLVTENMFENRFMHVPELCRMGANIVVDNHSAAVKGVNHLSGAEVMASDLRASSSLVIAGLAAHGTTKIRRVYHLDRGYEAIEQKLAACGADIQRVTGDFV